MHVHNRLRLPCCLFAEKEYYDANNIHEKFLNSDWLTAVRCFWNTEQKMKYGAKKRNTVQLFLNFFNFLNFLFFKFLNFLNFLISKCDLHTWLHNFFMYVINKYGFSSNLKKHTLVSFSETSNSTRPSDSCNFDNFDACFFPNSTRKISKLRPENTGMFYSTSFLSQIYNIV
jgi:hypothetical protein